MRKTITLLALATLGSPAMADPWRLPDPGDVRTRVTVEASLTRHRAMQPTSLAPDLVVGVREGLAVALHHSRALDGRLGAGNGLCVIGERETLGEAPAECDSSYTGVGLSAFREITPAVTIRAGLHALDTGPAKLATSVGAIARARARRWWATFAPVLVVGVAHRDDGNRERVQAPVYLGADIGRGELHLRTGFDATLATAADTFAVPLGIGGSLTIARRWRVGAELTLDRALGMLNATSWRSAHLYLELEHGGDS